MCSSDLLVFAFDAAEASAEESELDESLNQPSGSSIESIGFDDDWPRRAMSVSPTNQNSIFEEPMIVSSSLSVSDDRTDNYRTEQV